MSASNKWSRQDYRLTASVIKHTLENGGERVTLKALAIQLSDEYERDNPRFDLEKYLDYCGL